MTVKNFANNAVRLRLALVIAIVLLVAIASALGFFGIQYLNSKASDVSKVVYEATNSDKKLQRIQELANQLDSYQDAANRAQQVVAESKSYQYQDVIINDLQAMASKAGVSITNFSFLTAEQASTPAAKPAATPAAPTPAASPTPAGPKSTTVDISLSSPVDYQRLLRFIHYIEQNLTKMQISQVSLSSASDADEKNAVSIGTLTIEVYIR